MIPTQALLDVAADAIATDTAALAAALFLHVYPVRNPFVPGPNLTVGDVTKATFLADTSKATTSATMLTDKDPQTGEWIITVPEPAGGWHWSTGAAPVGLPETIYGFALTNVGESELWGTVALDTPIVLTGADEGFDLGQVQFRLSNSAMS